MIKLDLKRIFNERGIENPSRFLQKCGLPAYTAFRLLHNQVNSISFKHLETICLHLQCTIDDLCTWTPDSKMGIHKDHPLHKLKRTKVKANITAKINELPLDKLDQVRNFIEGLNKA